MYGRLNCGLTCRMQSVCVLCCCCYYVGVRECVCGWVDGCEKVPFVTREVNDSASKSRKKQRENPTSSRTG
jgi:hypothetical protein